MTLDDYDPVLIASLRRLGQVYGPEAVWAAAMRLDFTTHNTQENRP